MGSLRISYRLVTLLLLALLQPARAQFDLPMQSYAPVERATLSANLNFTTLQPGQQAVIAVVLDVADGYHAQSNQPLDEFLIPLTVMAAGNETVQMYVPVYPEPVIHDYPVLGRVSVFEGRTIIYLPIEVKPDASPGPITIAGQISYQICDDKVCFPPEMKEWRVETQIVAMTAAVEPNQPELFAGFDPRLWAQLQPAGADGAAAMGTRAEAISFLGWRFSLAHDAYVLTFALAFLAGIIFNIVPCVLPVLPLKAIGFYEVAQHNRARCLALGALFSAGIITTFGALALLVLVFHAVEWGQLFGNFWFAGAVTLILVAMAMGMFGFWAVVLPQKVYEVTPQHDTYLGNFLFGILTAVLSTPCTFGLFVALLFWAAVQPPWIGVAAVMTTGLGMAFPYLVLSAVPEFARKLPRTGPWSEVVKQMMGFLLLAIAAYFARVFLPDALRGPQFWWIVFAFVAMAFIFLIARTLQLAPRPRPILIAAAVSLVILIPAGYITYHLANPPMQWVAYSDDSFDEARATGKPVIVKFTADWCLNCQTVEATVFGNEETVRYLEQSGIVAIKADLTHQSAEGWGLLRSLNPVGAIPFTALYIPGEDAPRKLAGIYSTSDLMTALNGERASAGGTASAPPRVSLRDDR
jgi:thiol:disulfide interchange protein